ncbi:ATP-dependent DNA ligase [Phascolomyces articulosus]|uniref:DNA ligase n=1 Tax=Phascolomyces articulosus TaxID=60185 RepID=A0AAD5K3E1_9FUNG|nr:ATP-dependent DNA ligase [Phascolomyces articulosus]
MNQNVDQATNKAIPSNTKKNTTIVPVLHKTELVPDKETKDVVNSKQNEKGPLSHAQTSPAAATSSPSKTLTAKEESSGYILDQTISNCKIIEPSQPLTTDPLIFDPVIYPIGLWPTKYIQKQPAFSSPESIASTTISAPYSFLAQAFAMIAETSSRTAIIHILCNMLRVLIIHTPSDLLPALWLCSNSIGASYKGIELGIGPLVLTKALTSVSGATRQKLYQLYKDHGDWGDVAYAAKTSVRTIVQPKPLTIAGVFDTLNIIASVKGKGTVNEKCKHVQRLLLAAKDIEARYIVRTCVGNLRIGAVGTTVLVSFAHACVLSLTPPQQSSASPSLHGALMETWHEKESERTTLIRCDGDSVETLVQKMKHAEALLKECYAQCPDWDVILPWILKCGDISRIFEQCGLTVGVPLRPMLGQITKTMSHVFNKLQTRAFVCEFKYDGQRAQIHMDVGGNIRIFSRHLEDMTDKYPDIVSCLPHIKKYQTTSFIMDAEIVAINEQGKILPFQILSNRERKNVALEKIKINVCILAFDLMYLNDKSLLRLSFRERRVLLKQHFEPVENKFNFVNSIQASGTDLEEQERVQGFFEKSINQGCEGIMVKVLDHPNNTSTIPTVGARSQDLLATYEPDKRLESWLKVKKDYLEGNGDSLDLVPIGAWHGSGRKAGWYSPILLACYNPDNDTFESVCKCMSGFTDKFYKEMKQFYTDEGEMRRILDHPRRDYVTDLQPDVWFDATEVWEIKGADITISPLHKGAIGRIDENKGLSLRFPRYLRTRNDKSIYNATTGDTLAAMYSNQKNLQLNEGE